MTTNLDGENDRGNPRRNKWRYIVPDLPGWDSLEAVTRYHGWAEIIGIAVLFLLVISEVAAYRYGQRKDDLTTQHQEASDKRHDEEMARLHLETSQANERAATLEKETAAANERTAELKLALEKEIAARQPRTINPEQHSQIVKYLETAVPKERVVVIWKLFDEEAERFGKQVLAVLKDAKFDAVEARGPMGFSERGIFIVAKDLSRLLTERNAFGAIQAAFRDTLHIEMDAREMTDPFLSNLGDAVIIVAAKP